MVVQLVVPAMVLSQKNLYQSTFYLLDRRVSVDRLRRASIASSSSDLANSMSPPTVRFNMDAVALTPNPYPVSSTTQKRSPHR